MEHGVKMEQIIPCDSETVFLIFQLTKKFENVLFLSSKHVFKLFTRAVRNGKFRLSQSSNQMPDAWLQ